MVKKILHAICFFGYIDSLNTNRFEMIKKKKKFGNALNLN